jgi:23S rRNA (guanine745-N1)-methyltransferase
MRDDARVLADVVDLLRCPVCGDALGEAGGALRCAAGHSFDIARQGYVNLVPGRADTPEMVEARDAFLRAGHFRPLSTALAHEVNAGDGVVVDVGAGTGHHLAAVLDAMRRRARDGARRLPAALRRAARAHERAAAIGADAWKPLPLRDGHRHSRAERVRSAQRERDGEGPRADRRPHRGHPDDPPLHELVGPLGLLSVPDDKEDRLDAQLASHLTLARRRTIEHAMFLTRDECAQLVRMGPSAWHLDEQSANEGLRPFPSR